MPNGQCVAVTRVGSKYVFVFEYRNIMYLLLRYCYEMEHRVTTIHYQ